MYCRLRSPASLRKRIVWGPWLYELCLRKKRRQAVRFVVLQRSLCPRLRLAFASASLTKTIHEKIHVPPSSTHTQPSFNGPITRVILPPAHDLGLLSRGFYKRSSLLTSVPSRRPCLGREVLCPASPPLLNTDPEGMRAFFLLPLCSRTRLRLLQVFGFSLGAHWLASSVHLFQSEPIQKETSPVRYVM